MVQIPPALTGTRDCLPACLPACPHPCLPTLARWAFWVPHAAWRGGGRGRGRCTCTCECIAACTDSLAAVARGPEVISKALEEPCRLKLKGAGPASRRLGCELRQKAQLRVARIVPLPARRCIDNLTTPAPLACPALPKCCLQLLSVRAVVPRPGFNPELWLRVLNGAHLLARLPSVARLASKGLGLIGEWQNLHNFGARAKECALAVAHLAWGPTSVQQGWGRGCGEQHKQRAVSQSNASGHGQVCWATHICKEAQFVCLC